MRKTASSLDTDFDFDAEDMLAQFSTALASARILEKAKKEGVSMNEVSLVQEAGRTKCVTNEEKNRSNQLRKKQVLERLRTRSIRGENNLSTDISKRITRCQGLIHALQSLTTMGDKEVVTLGRNLESIYNRATSMVREVEVLEAAIERKKQEDPIILEVENASSEMFKAIGEKNTERVAELREFCERNMEVYNLRKKRLKPYLAQARQSRVKFIAEKRRLMRVQFELIFQVAERAAVVYSNGGLRFLDEEGSKILADEINSLREWKSKAKAFVDELDKPLGNIALSFLPDLEEAIHGVDQSFLVPMDEKLNLLMVQVKKGLLPPESDLTAKKAQKMARITVDRSR